MTPQLKPGCAVKAEDAFIKTCNGRMMHPWNLKPEDISLTDTVQAAANICRFNGNVQRRYTNLAHMLWCYYQSVKRQFSPETQLVCLVHDLHESVSLDMNSPLKDHIPGYRDFEATVKAPFSIRLGIDKVSDLAIGSAKRIDNEAYLIEAKYLQSAKNFQWLRDVATLGDLSPLSDFKRLLFTHEEIQIAEFKLAYAKVGKGLYD